MEQPTDKQIKKLWEWCGFYEHDHMGDTDIDAEVYQIDLYAPNGKLITKYPPIDLNNLFKYAVPKLPNRIIVFDKADGIWGCFIKGCEGAKAQSEGYNFDPALALFWAIWEKLLGV